MKVIYMDKEKKHFSLILEDEYMQKIVISTKTNLKELDEETINFEDLEDFLNVMSECYSHKFVKAYIEKNNDWLNQYPVKFAIDNYKLDDLRNKFFTFLTRHQDLLYHSPFSKLSKSEEMHNFLNRRIPKMSDSTISQIVYNYLKSSYTNQRQAYFMLKEKNIPVQTHKKAPHETTSSTQSKERPPINMHSDDLTIQELLNDGDFDAIYALYDSEELEKMGINFGDSFRGEEIRGRRR